MLLLLEDEDLVVPLLLVVEEDLDAELLLEDELLFDDLDIFRLPELLFTLLERLDIFEFDLVLLDLVVVVGLVLVEFVLILVELVPILVLDVASEFMVLRFVVEDLFTVPRLFMSPETVLLDVFEPLIEFRLVIFGIVLLA